ncbi:hypothetical protein ABZ635_07265 [Nocardiopsis sp. NPDC007018]|uniref:hypothetical protein n=1 Tax=Nocardiopsis sp. NPDC007018 TaxID=3155721 RepID=UPI0033F0B276
MKSMTVADLRRALEDLPGDQPVVNAATGHALVEVDSDPNEPVELLFIDTTPRRPKNRNTFVGTIQSGALMQIGGDHHGDISF